MIRVNRKHITKKERTHTTYTTHITHANIKASIEKKERVDCMFTNGEQTVWEDQVSILRHTHGERKRATQHTI